MAETTLGASSSRIAFVLFRKLRLTMELNKTGIPPFSFVSFTKRRKLSSNVLPGTV